MGRCIRMDRTGGPEVLELRELDLPEPGPGEVRLAVHAAGLNFIDTYHRTGLYPVRLPFVPGVEAVGEVEATGPGVEHVSPGERVGYLGGGGYATHLNARADRLVPLPDSLDFIDAAAVLLKGLTAWMLLFEVRPMAAGETALVWAPVGGVGSLLVPWARSFGVRVIAVTSSEDKVQKAKALGAGHVIFRDGDDVAGQVRELTGSRGVDVAFDSVGKASQQASLASLKPRGWWVSYGNASGPAAPVAPAELSQLGSLVMTRPGLFHFIADRSDLLRGCEAVFGALDAGTISASVQETFSLQDAPRAQELLASGTTQGALVLVN